MTLKGIPQVWKMKTKKENPPKNSLLVFCCLCWCTQYENTGELQNISTSNCVLNKKRQTSHQIQVDNCRNLLSLLSKTYIDNRNDAFCFPQLQRRHHFLPSFPSTVSRLVNTPFKSIRHWLIKSVIIWSSVPPSG